MEVCLVLGGGKVKVLGDDRLANLRLTAKQRDSTYRQLASPANTDANDDPTGHSGRVRETR
jgi:hypothetical protein